MANNKEFKRVKDETLDNNTEIENRINLQRDEIKFKHTFKLILIIIMGFFIGALLQTLCSIWDIKIGDRTIIEYYVSFMLPVLTLMIGVDVGQKNVKRNKN